MEQITANTVDVRKHKKNFYNIQSRQNKSKVKKKTHPLTRARMRTPTPKISRASLTSSRFRDHFSALII